MASILGTDERPVFSDSFGSLKKCFQRHKRLSSRACFFTFMAHKPYQTIIRRMTIPMEISKPYLMRVCRPAECSGLIAGLFVAA